MPRWRRPSASRLEMWERCCDGLKKPCARRSIVRHLSDGTLRRIYDEPLALTSLDQAHFDGCTECKARFESIANTAGATATLLSVPGFAPEPAAGLRSARVLIRTGETARPPRRDARWVDPASRRRTSA